MLLVALLLLSAGALASLRKPYYPLEEADSQFASFIQTYKREYKDEAEKNMRFEIFKQNVAIINERNNDPEDDADYDINEFIDMTEEEFIKQYTGFVSPDIKCTLMSESHIREDSSFHSCKVQTKVETFVHLPESLDWRTKNVVTPVKHQKCGDCWTFGTAGNVESMYAIKHNKLIDFSSQQLLDCDKLNNGCEGGTYNLSFGGLVSMGGLMTLEDYPYEGEKKECRFDKSKIKVEVTDCILYDLKDEEQLRHHVATNGPVAVAIDARDVKAYNGGIMNKCHYNELNHAVLLVGYGTDDKGTDYWIYKNSWGVGTGEKGYFRTKRNINACGVINPCAATAIVE